METNGRGVLRDGIRRPRVEYGRDYFARYHGYRDTELGKRITEFRANIVSGLLRPERVLDVGIGAGAFIEAIQARGIPCLGYDVNPFGIEWLRSRGIYCDPWRRWPDRVDAVTLWDVLEHFPDPGAFLARMPLGTKVAVSIPIPSSFEGIEEWKHFRPGEHLWYWTRDGFVDYFAGRGFSLSVETDYETQLGREDIRTFVFQKERVV